MSFLFETHKKGSKKASLHSPCWLTVGKHAPSILLNHRTLEKFVISGDTNFFLHDKALCYQSLPAWACKSLPVYLTKWAECDIAGGQSASQPEPPNSCWGAPRSLTLNTQDQHQRKAHEMPGPQFNGMEMTTGAILILTPHASECTWMLNCHLLFSLALLCLVTRHCLRKCDGSCVSEWKTLFSCHTLPQ